MSKIDTPKIDKFSKFWLRVKCVNLWRTTVCTIPWGTIPGESYLIICCHEKCISSDDKSFVILNAKGLVSGLNRTCGMFYLFEIQMNLHVELDRVTIGFDVIQFGFGKCSDCKFLIIFRLDFPNSKDLWTRTKCSQFVFWINTGCLIRSQT